MEIVVGPDDSFKPHTRLFSKRPPTRTEIYTYLNVGRFGAEAFKNWTASGCTFLGEYRTNLNSLLMQLYVL